MAQALQGKYKPSEVAVTATTGIAGPLPPCAITATGWADSSWLGEEGTLNPNPGDGGTTR